MEQHPQSFEAFGFTIEVHAGGRRVWPPSFKRYIARKMDSGELTVAQIMEACKASKSLVYKWRADVKDSKNVRSVAVRQEKMFSEVLIKEAASGSGNAEWDGRIHLIGRGSSLTLPITYPVEDLVKIILALEGHA
ncbi:hypothetical protein ACMA5I_14975 [Paracoccaceae bacterium GXU_MW_L88]